MPKVPAAQFSASWTLHAAKGALEAECPATRAFVVVPQCVQIVAVVLIPSSLLTTQLAFRQQPRLHLDELLFVEKELQQLVLEQVTETCKSV